MGGNNSGVTAFPYETSHLICTVTSVSAKLSLAHVVEMYVMPFFFLHQNKKINKA